ncbi:MAG: oligosaccharide flippase family protein [Salinivirgaceae bacterium]|nr:oligosaccharide flippase family protein [Salinivirgaceae bacterium]
MKSGIVKNTSKLLAANIIAQAVGFAVYPILTRLYSPDDFGALNIFLTIGGIATLFATAEYQNSIMLPKNEKSGVACFHIGFIITLIVTLIFALSIPFANQISHLLDVPQLSTSYWMLPIYILVISLWTLLNYWHTRNERFTSVSAYQITQCITGAGVKWGLARFASNGLIIGSVVAPLVALASNIATTFRTAIKPLLTFDKEECRRMAREYVNFPKFSLPRSIVNYISSNLPILMLTPFFSLTEIGYYGMALTLAFTPITLIIKSVFQVFFQDTTQRVQRGESICEFFKKLQIRTVLIVLPLFVTLYFILPQLTKWLLGEGWENSGIYIQAMLPWILMTTLVGPICYLSDIFKKQKVGFLFEMLTFVLRIAGLALGIWSGNFLTAIIGYSAGGFVAIFAQLIWYWSLIGKYEKQLKTK